MHTILYISQETQPFSKSDLHDLLAIAITNNRKNNVTGCLHYEAGFFMQYIEGSETSVNETMANISVDSRHRVFYHSEERDLKQRRFPDWYMHWEDRPARTDTDTALLDLERTLKPFDQLYTSAELESAFLTYKQIAYDHVLRGMAVSRKELHLIADALSMAVHDLRTPLRSVRALIDMYVEDAGDKIDPEFKEPSILIGGALNRMDKLIDGVVDHIETDSQSEIDWVDLTLVIEEIAASAKLTNTNFNVVTQSQLPKIKGNPLNIWRVLNGLITNGLKYNQSEEPCVQVSAEMIDSTWQICVSDNGIGIDKAYQKRVFVMFQRLHPQSTYPGNGIGLATCKKLVEQWEGQIWIESSENEGSQFYFTYPSYT